MPTAPLSGRRLIARTARPSPRIIDPIHNHDRDDRAAPGRRAEPEAACLGDHRARARHADL